MDQDAGYNYEIHTYWDHMVSQWAGISILEVQELNILDFLILKRDAFISRLGQTEEGREYLKNAYRLEQTTPNKEKLREKFGSEG